MLLEVTSRCDLACPVCYASASRDGADASLAEIDGWLDALAEAGGRVHIQLSGGEPTTRDDLPEIVARVRARGFDFVQLNTNGVRVARQPNYLAALAEAGLDCVFLQFDGVSDDVYRRLRGAKLMRLKAQAIDNCSAAGVGVVLTPTLVPGVNVSQIGAIVDFAIARLPAVRAVHFQPVSYFGRCLAEPDADSRITLPEVMGALIAHSGGTIRLADFRPGSAEIPIARSAADSSSRPTGASFRSQSRHRHAATRRSRCRERHVAVRPGRAPTSRASDATSRGNGRASAAPARRAQASTRSTLSLQAVSGRSASPAWRSRTPGRSISTGCASATSMLSRPIAVSSRSAPIT